MTVTPLAAGTTTITVTAADRYGSLPSAVHTFVVTVPVVRQVPPAPPQISVSKASGARLDVRWTAPANAGPPVTDYDYRYRSRFPEGAWVEVTDTAVTGLSVTIAGLLPRRSYEVQVRARNAAGAGRWSASGRLYLDARLLYIRNLDQLRAVIWDPDGDGSPRSQGLNEYIEAFPRRYCAPRCDGYRLAADLDLDEDGGGSGDHRPIGGERRPYTAMFDGNGHTIRNLRAAGSGPQGLFGVVGRGGFVRNVRLIDVDVRGAVAGGLAGRNRGGVVTGSSVSGAVESPGRLRRRGRGAGGGSTRAWSGPATRTPMSPAPAA